MAEKKSSGVDAEPREATTEPAVVKKFAKGGALGGGKGALPGVVKKIAAEMPAKEPGAMKKFASEAPTVGGLKKGGKVESLKKELRHHEAMKAPPAHTGKVMKKADGGAVSEDKRIGREGKPHSKQQSSTGAIEESSYKKGGVVKSKGGAIADEMDDSSRKGKQEVVERMVQTKASGGSVKPFENTKVSSAAQTKSFNTSTKGVEGDGYKKGGHVAHHHHKAHGHKDGVMRKASGGSVAKFAEDKHDTVTGHKAAHKTGEIKQDPAGFKHGGHVSHHHAMTKHHEGHGHKAMSGEGHGHHEHHAHAHGGRVHGGRVKGHCSGGSMKKY